MQVRFLLHSNSLGAHFTLPTSGISLTRDLDLLRMFAELARVFQVKGFERVISGSGHDGNHLALLREKCPGPE